VVLVVLAILGAPLMFYVLRELTRDPVFVEMDGLDVPGWAAGKPKDSFAGSRWCVQQCRFRQRTWESQRDSKETSGAFEKALTANGWRPWHVKGCPQPQAQQKGVETCWQRDEYVLDLWVYQPECEVKEKPADPGNASAAPNVEAVCPNTVVQVKVVNRAAYHVSG